MEFIIAPPNLLNYKVRKEAFGNMNKNEHNKKKGLGKKVALIIGTSLALIASFILGNISSALGVGIKGFNGLYSIPTTIKSEDVSKFKTLFEVKSYLEELYNGEINEEDLVHGAVKGMTAALNEPYTIYMTSEEYDRYMESNSGQFKGIGVYMSVQNEQVKISSVIEESPAESVGIKAGDIIAMVGDEEIGSDTEKAVSLIKGTDKTVVNITILRDQEVLNFDVERSEIKTISVKGEMLNEDIGYIMMSTFDKNVSEDFIKYLKEFKDSGMKGLIIDLRGNGGGYLNEAQKIASQFIPKGKTITYTIDNKGKKTLIESEGGLEEGIPLVILTDGYTASASEVITGALRDYDMATTVGTTTFGKGIVQIPFELKSGDGGLKVTVSKYYTPNGENIHEIGIKPDYEVNLTKEEATMNPYDRNKDPQFLKGLEVINEKIK